MTESNAHWNSSAACWHISLLSLCECVPLALKLGKSIYLKLVKFDPGFVTPIAHSYQL